MDKENINLGTIEGEILLFGGIYSNLQALESVIDVAKEKNIPPSQCFCTGDIIGYCAQPKEVVQLFRDWGAHSIIGNVEEQLRSEALHCGCDFKAGSKCDNLSQKWYPFAQKQLSKEVLDWMKTLPNHISFTFSGKTILLVHGSYNHISEFIFKSTPWATKQETFSVNNCDVVIAGHCGLPFHDEHKNKLWLNPGVIGMPANNAETSVWYATLNDLNGFNFKHHVLNYDYVKTNELMAINNLPEEYAKTLLTGLWDNMEILPETERLLQGQPIVFS